MPSPPFEYDFFVSRRGTVDADARDVANILIGEGFKVTVQDFDFPSGGHFVGNIDDALKKAQHLLILYSHDYDTNFWTQQEFRNFMAARAANPDARRIGLLRCDAAAPAGLLAGITHGVLTGISDPEQRRQIVLAVANGQAPAAPATPRVFGGAMPPRNRLFTGRDDLLTRLHTALTAAADPVALTQTAVHGLGGIGKTSLAREYIARHDADYPGGVWWIVAADRAGTVAGLRDLALAMIPGLAQDMPPEDAARAALDLLGKRQTPFLLVFDNAPDPASLRGLLPDRGARVLITSRHPGWQRQAETLPVTPMTPPEAESLLLRLTDSQDSAGTGRLAEALGYLPLALDHAGAYARDAGIGFDEYRRRVDELIGVSGGNPDYPDSVAATFTLAIARAAAQSPAAEPILGLFAWYAPEAIPLCLLDDSLAPPTEREAAIRVLVNLSLLARAPDGAAGPAVSVHRLVQTVTRTRLGESGTLAAVRAQATARLTAEFPYGYSDAAVWPVCRALLPHARAIEDRLDSDETAAAAATLLGLMGSFLLGSGDAAGALPLFRRGLESRERVLGSEHPDTLSSVDDLAVCLSALGDAAGALPLYRRGLESRERVLGADHPQTLGSVNNLAACLRALGDAAGALPLFRRGLESSERVLGADHPGTLTSVNNLAACLRALGDAAGALPLYRRGLEGCERVLGADHPDTLGSVNNLAMCLYALGDAAGALPLFRRGLESCEHVLGADHPDTLISVNNLALCLEALGDAAGALPLYRRGLENRERVLGADHPQTLGSVNNLAMGLWSLGDRAGAVPLLRRAAEGFARLLGPDHPSTKQVRANYEAVVRAAGPSGDDAARPWWRRLLGGSTAAR